MSPAPWGAALLPRDGMSLAARDPSGAKVGNTGTSWHLLPNPLPKPPEAKVEQKRSIVHRVWTRNSCN